jgi:2-succinyl-6-hydroxy-2,4-cyclohexadiene-1-carboxylate synthase
MASAVAGVMDQLNLAQAHVIGSSLGAEVGLSLAANYPDKVISLVCDGALESESGPYSTWEGTEAEFEAHVAQQLDNIRDMPEPVFSLAEAYVASRREIIEKYVDWNDYFEAVERYNAMQTADGTYTKAFGKQALLSYMENYFYYRFEDYYKRVRCPLLLLPDADVLENEKETAVMHALQALAPQAEIADVSNWNHPYGWLLDPDEAVQAILKFLDNTTQ